MSDIQYFTQDGLDALKEELNQLKHVERPKIIQAIAEARDKGDLSENAEYDAAKEAQGHDWAVFRHRWSLRAYAVTWQSEKEKAEFIKELELCDD